MVIVSIYANKGGVGKTSMCYALAYTMSRKGYKVLYIDTDPQCNSFDIGRIVGREFEGKQRDFVDVLEGLPISNCIQMLDGSIDIVVNNRSLADITQRLNEESGGSYCDRYSESLNSVVGRYDAILIDCSPSMESIIPRYSVVRSDLVLIPFVPNDTIQLGSTVDTVRYCKDNNVNFGVVVNQYVDDKIQHHIISRLRDIVSVSPIATIPYCDHVISSGGNVFRRIDVGGVLPHILQLIPSYSEIGRDYNVNRGSGQKTQEQGWEIDSVEREISSEERYVGGEANEEFEDDFDIEEDDDLN